MFLLTMGVFISVCFFSFVKYLKSISFMFIFILVSVSGS
jgi:hypothetical protein